MGDGYDLSQWESDPTSLTPEAIGVNASDPCIARCFDDFKQCCDDDPRGGAGCLANLSACLRRCGEG
jgi:hypothetical protein